MTNRENNRPHRNGWDPVVGETGNKLKNDPVTGLMAGVRGFKLTPALRSYLEGKCDESQDSQLKAA